MTLEQALEYLIDEDSESETTSGLEERVVEETTLNLPHKLTGRIPFEVVELIGLIETLVEELFGTRL